MKTQPAPDHRFCEPLFIPHSLDIYKLIACCNPFIYKVKQNI